MWARYRVMLLLITAYFMIACSTGQAMDVPATKVITPPGLSTADSVTWLPTGQLVVGNSNEIWYQTTKEDVWNQIPLDKDPQCLKTYYYQLSALSDGRLGMVKNCTGTWQDSSRQMFHELATMVAYDWKSGKIEPLVAGALPDSGQFDWNPDMSKGVFTTIGSFSTLYWLTASGTQPITITLTKDTRSWFLPDSIVAAENYDKNSNLTGREPHPVGLVRDPAWSHNGDHIAFWATLETIGHPFDFPIVSWDIYLMDPSTLHIERILEDVYDPKILAWSPDSQWLVYISGPGGKQSEGLWLFSLQTRKSTLIREGHFTDAAWSPDGRTIVSILCSDAACNTTELWKYDVHTIVS
jgi:hypothetical protein